MRKAILMMLFVCLSWVGAVQAAEIGEDGLHKQPWFAQTFRDMAEDLATAKSESKRLAIIFEQRGCIYCKKMHETVFIDKEFVKYVTDNFMVVQYNLFGDEEVIDLDGETLTEKTAARKWRVIYTPTVMFLPEDAKNGDDAGRAAVSVMPGAFGKWTTLNMYKWVVAKGYEGDEHFQKFHARKLNEAREAGKLKPAS